MQIETMNPIKSPSLYRLTGDLLDALGEITVDPETGEVTGFERFDALVIDTEAKIVNCGLAMRHFDDMTDDIDKEIKRLRKRKEVIQKASERMQTRMLAAMRVMDTKKISSAILTVTARKSSCVDIYDQSQLDPRFFKTKEVKTVSKDLIEKALKAGEDVQGARIKENFSIQLR